MLKLFTINYISKYYENFHTSIKISALTEEEALIEALKRLSVTETKEPMTLLDLSIDSVDHTYIEIDKSYKTKNGKNVLLYKISTGKDTFCVKGSIETNKIGRFGKTVNEVYAIWTIHGKHEAINNSELDLIEVA